MENLTELANELALTKSRESEIKAKRVELENEIAKLVETSPTGSKTVDAGNGLKVTVKRGLTYSADVDEIRGLDLSVLPLKHVPATYAFDSKVYEKMVASDPDAAKKLAEFVESKPRKVSVTLKVG